MDKQKELTELDSLRCDYHIQLGTIALHLAFLCDKIGYKKGYKKLFAYHTKHQEYVCEYFERLSREVLQRLKENERRMQLIGTLYPHKRLSDIIDGLIPQELPSEVWY